MLFYHQAHSIFAAPYGFTEPEGRQGEIVQSPYAVCSVKSPTGYLFTFNHYLLLSSLRPKT